MNKCQHKEYCSIEEQSGNNFCKDGTCKMKDTDLKELPLLSKVKQSIANRERASRFITHYEK